MSEDSLFQPVLSRDIIYHGKYLDLEKREILLPDEESSIREIVKVRDAAAILPVDDEGNVYLVRQHRRRSAGQ